MINKKVAAWLVIGTAVIFALAVARAFGIPTAGNRPNSVGVSETYQSPVTYLFDLPIDGQILDDRYTNIRFKPYATVALYDQTVLFCGDVTGQFDGKTGPVVVTYYTQASGRHDGIGCHDLVSVFTVGQ
jgi:hypothetical protein